jgi:hypothetical protein
VRVLRFIVSKGKAPDQWHGRQRFSDSSGGYQPLLPPIQPSPGPQTAVDHHTGKVIGIHYDRFGDFEGFTLLSKNGREHEFRSREHRVEEMVRRAWIERTLIRVFAEAHDPDWPASIILEK